jgi:uridine phosphorylase
LDNLLHYYRLEHNEEEKQLLQSFCTQTQIQAQMSQPYISSASPSLLKHFVKDFFHGITVSCPGFYGPQGRVLRLGVKNPQLINNLTQFIFGKHRITNFEMETSGIYGLGRLLGHHCLSLNTIVANRVSKEFTKDGKASVENLIKKTLEILSNC